MYSHKAGNIYCKYVTVILIKLNIIFTFLLFFINISYAYVPVVTETKDMIDREIKKSAQNMSEGIRGEFEKAMLDLFENKLNPLLDEIDLVISSNLEHADEIAEKRLNQIQNILYETIDKFKKSTEETIHTIKDDIIGYAFEQLDKERAKLHSEIDWLFNEKIPNLFNCQLLGGYELVKTDYFRMIGELKDYFRPSFFLPKCYKEIGISNFPDDGDYSKIFLLYRCKKIREINERTPIETIKGMYVDLSLKAKRFGCIESHSNLSSDFYHWPIIEFESSYNLWKWIESY